MRVLLDECVPLGDGVPPIELIDGEKLIEMLEQLELGLRPVKTYEVDHVFFREFEGQLHFG